jgi:hypothetical protein
MDCHGEYASLLRQRLRRAGAMALWQAQDKYPRFASRPYYLLLSTHYCVKQKENRRKAVFFLFNAWPTVEHGVPS